MAKSNANGGIVMARLPARHAIRRLAPGLRVPGVGMALAIVVGRRGRPMAIGIHAFGETEVFNAVCAPIHHAIAESFVIFGHQNR